MPYLATSTKLFATKQLDGFGKSISNSYDRLSSGMRINKISDDAAGVAQNIGINLSNKLANRGISNLQDGVSAMNIADSALGEMSNVLSRIQELAQQAANGTYTNDQRSVLQSEASALTSEYNRIIRTTEFNDSQLLTGSSASINFKGGFGQIGDLSSRIGDTVTSDAYGIYSTGTTELVSSASDGTLGNSANTMASVSSDGRFIVFGSSANNLISGVSGPQMYLKDTETGALSLVSSNSSGDASNGASLNSLGISRDGKFATFLTNATNIIAGVTGTQLYIKNLETNQVTLVSANEAGVEAGASGGGGISVDNRYVGMTSPSTTLIPGVTGAQLYVKDLLTGEVKLSTSDSSGNQSSGGSLTGGALDRFGNHFFTHTATNLVSGVTGQQGYFKNHSTGTTTLVTSNAIGEMANSSTNTLIPTADGYHAVFSSDATNLVSGVTGDQIYKKNLLTGEIEAVSRSASGELGNGSSSNPNISSDGRYLIFNSDSSNLVSGVSGNQIYRKDLETGEVVLVSRATDGTTASSVSASSVARMSDNGQKIFFLSSASNIVSGDSNGVNDIFMRDMSTAGVQQLSGVILTDQASARISSDLIQVHMDEINLAKAQVGATTSRFGFANSHLHSLSSNFADASSKIMSVDVAEETASLVSNQIKQQSAMAVLAHNSKSYDLSLLSF